MSVLARRFAVRAAAARAFHSTAPRSAEFSWNKLVTPLTNPQFINRMKELDVKFGSMKSEMYGVAPKVEEIDWAFWEKNIENKDVVSKLKAEYQSMKFDEVKGEDLTKVNSDLDAAIAKASQAAAFSTEELPKLQQVLQRAVADKAAVHGWNAEEYFRRYPGLEQQLRDEYMEGEFLPSSAEDRLEAQDINEARKQFKSGAEVQVPDEIADHVGDFNIKEENAKVSALLNRMFAGAKTFEAQQQAEKEAEAKKASAREAQKAAAAAAAAAEHH